MILSALRQICVVCGFQSDAFLEQPLPTEPALQPLSNHGIALNVSGELSGSQTMPRAGAPCAFLTRQIADLNVSVVNAVLFPRKTLCSFEAKAHRNQRHGRSPFPGQRCI